MNEFIKIPLFAGRETPQQVLDYCETMGSPSERFAAITGAMMMYETMKRYVKEDQERTEED